jgi:cbb3-type cytochrome oxidase subunit 3
MSNVISLSSWIEHYSVVGMVAVFVLIFATTYWPGRKSRVEQHGSIPLNDDR